MSNHGRIRIALAPILGILLVLFASGVGNAAASGSDPAPNCRVVFFDRGNFTNPTNIDNLYLPLKPGAQLTLSGTVNSSGAATDHTVVFTVTDLTKQINGVRTRVVYDVDISGGLAQEIELAFFAQDRDGSVWNLGEYPEENTYNPQGKLVKRVAPSTWLSGVNGALPGVHMFAQPKVGTPGYLQGWSSTIDFLDCAQVAAKGQTITVPFHNTTYGGVLVTNEWSPLDGPATQQKYHAPGVGIVKIGATNDPQAEILALSNLKQLDATALAQIRTAALQLDSRGCKLNTVYCNAPAAQ